jgi:7-carboxy-7-deazaguanine synthase
MNLPISEIFDSIQGEGMFTGVPSTFVRTSGCNLRCWWCDTPYTSWKPEKGRMTVDKIMEQIEVDGNRHVVITGGEPMLHRDAVREITRRCRADGRLVTIETNGTIYDETIIPTLWSVSPKLLSSTPTNQQGEKERSLHLRNIRATELKSFCSAQYTQYKFVVTCENDMVEITSMLKEHRMPLSSVWLMPEGRTAEEITIKSKWVVELCKHYGFNFSTRLHTLLWGAKRGV